MVSYALLELSPLFAYVRRLFIVMNPFQALHSTCQTPRRRSSKTSFSSFWRLISWSRCHESRRSSPRAPCALSKLCSTVERQVRMVKEDNINSSRASPTYISMFRPGIHRKSGVLISEQRNGETSGAVSLRRCERYILYIANPWAL